MHKLTPEFSFAGFTFPRYLADLPIGKHAMQRKRQLRKHCGGYYHAPTPDSRKGWGFYYESDSSFTMRIEETGKSYSWGDCRGDAYVGIVARLNHGRGFLAGASMGSHMVAFLDPKIYADESDAIRAANDAAQSAADEQAEYEAGELEC